MISIYWKDGSQSTWSAPYLSFADGYLYDFNHLHIDDMETLGVRLSRGFHSTDPTDEKAHFIAEEKVIIAPEELKSVLMVVNNGSVKLMYDPQTDKLADVLIPQIEALVYGKTENDALITEEQDEVGQQVESLSAIDAGIGL